MMDVKCDGAMLEEAVTSVLFFSSAREGRMWGKGGKSIFAVDTSSRESIRFSRTPVPMFWDLLPFFCRLILSRYCARECAPPSPPPSPRAGENTSIPGAPGIVVWLLYIYERTNARANVSHARERGTRRGCAARIFNGASACVRLSSPRDLSGGEKKNWRGETARRASERKKERTGFLIAN